MVGWGFGVAGVEVVLEEDRYACADICVFMRVCANGAKSLLIKMIGSYVVRGVADDKNRHQIQRIVLAGLVSF